jgi:branched-chain amino acid aminotransferase
LRSVIPEGVVDIDGLLQRAEDAKVSVFDRGFLYGDSAFEAMRTYGRKPFRQREHVERLERSCRLLRIELPLALDALEQRIAGAIAASGLPECYLRIMVTRGVGSLGLDLSQARRPSVVVYALALNVPDVSLYREGIAVALVSTLRSTDGGPAAGAKASNYLASLLALDDARQRGCQEAILLGSRGEVLEGTTTNVFVVRGGELCTPPCTQEILEGITRRTVLELARERALACCERVLLGSELVGADEVFVTSSVRELVPVVRVDDRPIGDGKPGLVFAALHAAYRGRAAGG